jgi:hypothetical protein
MGTKQATSSAGLQVSVFRRHRIRRDCLLWARNRQQALQVCKYQSSGGTESEDSVHKTGNRFCRLAVCPSHDLTTFSFAENRGNAIHCLTHPVPVLRDINNSVSGRSKQLAGVVYV